MAMLRLPSWRTFASVPLRARFSSSSSSCCSTSNESIRDDTTTKHRSIHAESFDQANARLAGNFRIQSMGNDVVGYGVVALREYPAGEFVLRGHALQITSTPTAHSIQIDSHQHALMDLPAVLLNHHCGPTANLTIARRQEDETKNKEEKRIRQPSTIAYDFYARLTVSVAARTVAK
jgi:hypothetical protein